ncbi:MAG: DUF1269 domain-containing protein [Caldilineaceae bacterium]|nr:DUF1269 domain-containing protein [Caldilineaceae bacterium]
MAKELEGNVVVLMFEDQISAENMLDNMVKWQEEGLVKIADAVTVTRGVGPDLEIKQTHKFAGKYSRRGAGIGLLGGLLIGGPIGGLIAGAVIGGIGGAMKDYGIDDKFIEEVSAGLKQESSALFLMVVEADGPRMLEVLRPFKARVASTTLDPDQEARLVDALAREEGV